jgi:hypothetical protein
MWYSYVSADLPTTTGQEDEVMGNSGGKGLWIELLSPCNIWNDIKQGFFTTKFS